jgi:hypothetical protein
MGGESYAPLLTAPHPAYYLGWIFGQIDTEGRRRR